MNLKYDVFVKSSNKYKEQFCGDYSLVSQKDGITRVLIADGLGSGFTANLHASMTAKMILSLTENGEGIERTMSTVIGSMTKDNSRKTDYCAFILIEIDSKGKLEVVNYNMPDPVFMRHGKIVKVKAKTQDLNERKIKTFTADFSVGDSISAFSDGIINAGIGASLNLGIGRKNVASYLEAAYKPRISSKQLVELLMNVCDSLYLSKPGDDYTAAVIKAVSAKAKEP